MPDLIDYTADLQALTDLAARPAALDELLERALDALETLVPYDLAAVFELRGDELIARTARGPLATRPIRGHRLQLAQQPTIRRALHQRHPIAMRHHHHAEEGDPFDGILDLPHGHACMIVPLFAADRALGIITLDRAICQTYADTAITIAGVYAQIVALAMIHAEQTQVLQRYRDRLQEQNRLLRDETTTPTARIEDTRTPAMQRLLTQARQVAVTTAPVLILGETGVGKEVLAQAIHDYSPRRDQPFIKLNCAAIPDNLIESELFGHIKGAFTGATGRRPGRFLTANGGTLLLDEIGELPPGAQAKLLRVLQEGTFEPVGSDETARVDVRILAATHLDLATAVQTGRFRADLWYRLDVFPLTVPPLRDRVEDIIPLAQAILTDIGRRTARGPWHLTPEAIRSLRAHPWPGNVRQLVNALERATILHPDGPLDASLFDGHDRPTPTATPTPPPTTLATLAEVQRRHIEAVLTRTQGKIYGDDGAAAILGLKPTTLQSRMIKLHVTRS